MTAIQEAAPSCTYIIASHTQPKGVARLARVLATEVPSSHVFIHHDSKSGKFPASYVHDMPNIGIASDPIGAEWGTFSLVELVLKSLREISTSGRESDWFIFLSGQHYPIRPMREFETMLRSSSTDALMTFDPVKPFDRHFNDRYKFHYRRISQGHLPRVLRAKRLYDTVFNRVQPVLRVQSDPRGSFVGWRPHKSAADLGMQIYTGSQWWALSRRAIKTVLDTVDRNPGFVAAFDGTLIPDEAFFQTLVMNAPNLSATNVGLHFAKWPLFSSSPSYLTINDLDEVLGSDKWFARKVDDVNDAGLRDYLDLNRQSPLLRNQSR